MLGSDGKRFKNDPGEGRRMTKPDTWSEFCSLYTAVLLTYLAEKKEWSGSFRSAKVYLGFCSVSE